MSKARPGRSTSEIFEEYSNPGEIDGAIQKYTAQTGGDGDEGEHRGTDPGVATGTHPRNPIVMDHRTRRDRHTST